MKTVSVPSGKGAHFYLSADFSSDRVIQFLFGNRFFVHCFNVTFSFPVLVALTSERLRLIHLFGHEDRSF